MSVFNVSGLPSSDSLISRVEDLRTDVKNALVKVVSELDHEADASLFDLRFLPLALNEPAEIETFTLNPDDNEPLTLNLSDGTDLELDELSTDDLVNLYQTLMDLIEELNEEE